MEASPGKSGGGRKWRISHDRRTTDVQQCQKELYHVVGRILVSSILSRLVNENEEIVWE